MSEEGNGARQQIRLWLAEGYTPAELFERYEELLEITGSKMSRKTYERTIYKVRRQNRRSESGGKVEKDKQIAELSLEQRGNELFVESKTGGRIKNLDDLIREAEVDLDIWKVDEHTVNPYEVTMKLKEYNSDDKLIEVPKTFTNFQVKAKLSKRTPDVTFMPALQKIELVGGPYVLNYPDERARSIKTALILSDAQMAYRRDFLTNRLSGFHDRAIFDIALQVALIVRPDVIILNGDMLDLPEWSDKFLQSPETWWTLQPAMLELSWWLKRFRENLPDARMIYMEGNHEERMPRSILRYQASAYGLKRVDNLEGIEVLSIPNLLALDQLAIEWYGGYPANHVWLNSEFRVSHGNGTGFDKMLKEAEVSESIGHIHKLVKHSKTRHVRGGEKVVELSSSGCMARRDGAVPGSEGRMDWQGGFELVHYESDGKLFETQLVHVNGDRTLFNGHSVTARDRREDIMRDYAQEAPFLRFE